MQEPSHSSDINASATVAQIYQAQMEDYESMLSLLRAKVVSIAQFAQVMLSPRTFSPLHKASEAGYLNELEKSATLLGDQVRHDRMVSLPRATAFYGLAPWNPTDIGQHQATIDALQEKIASHYLRLEEDFDILELRRAPTEADHEAFKAVPAASSDPSSVDAQKLQRQVIRDEVIETIKSFLPETSPAPFTHFAHDILSSATVEQVRATPTVYLQKVLESPEAEKLSTDLLSTLNWYGSKPDEDTSPKIRIKVIANALQIWLQSPTDKHPQAIAGYDWQARTNWGKSYQDIRKEFEAHLLTSKRAVSEKEAIVIARLFLGQFPVEFRVPDIPADLRYRSSPVWVNFLNGVNLINATDPEALCRMTFQQLVDLPLKRTEGATSERLKETSLTRLLPTLDWAVTQGIIAHKRRMDYTVPDIERALTALDTHTNTLKDAITQIAVAPPNRLSMAKKVAEKFFGKDFVAQNRKMARKREEVIRWNSVPTLPGKEYEFYSIIDILASNVFADGARWYYTLPDGSVGHYYLEVASNRQIVSPFYFPEEIPGAYGRLPEVKALFYSDFMRYLELQTIAYKTLIRSQLASLAFADRQAIELGELSVYTLRKEIHGVEAKNETAASILPWRARIGFILRTTYAGETKTYELLPRAGVIRRIENLAEGQYGGAEHTEKWRLFKSTVSVTVLRHKKLPFDWNAHATGSSPRQGAVCDAIIEQLGDVFGAPSAVELPNDVPLTLSSPRCVEISNLIADGLPFVDPQQLSKVAAGKTQFDQEQEELEKTREIIKMFVPFWKSIEDLASGDRSRLVNGVFGLFADLLSFAQPIGKFASGSLKLISNAGRLTLRAKLPAFASLSKELVILSIQALNPAEGVAALLHALGSRGLRFGQSALIKVKHLTGQAGQYDLTRSLPRLHDSGRWKPLVSGDHLATIRGVDDVPVRNIASTGKADYRLIDPLSSKPYGPLLNTPTNELSLGRSRYATLENNNRHVIVELAENSRIHEVLEVDGRTTLFINDQPYRLKNGLLHRAELTDDITRSIPCRIPRAPGAPLCQTSYVTRDPAPTPDTGSVDQVKGWAPWFGDSLYTPASGRAAMRIDAMLTPSTLTATMEFQKGIYGRVMVSIPAAGQDLVDNLRTGATIVEAIDGTKHYIFMRLHAGNFYVAERAKGQNLFDLLTFKKAETLPPELKNELMVVYTGSLNANNMVRIHGQQSVERALKAMDDIAIPIGSHVNPPETLKLLKVDTSPGEAALFDHATRMIVRSSTDGATTWSLSRAAPDGVRETTAEVFNNLFGKKVITVEASTGTGAKALKIDDTMRQLQRLISTATRRPVHSPRNIAFARIKTKAGVEEVYVSVSGQQGDTGFLPLFAASKGAKEVMVGDVRYFNIDSGARFPQTALHVMPEGKLQAIPHTIDNIEKYTPALTARPTSLDTESKLIAVIRSKYPDPKELDAITIATTMAPCDSCSVVMKQFAYDGSPNALEVIWK